MAFATTLSYKGPTVDFAAVAVGVPFRFFYPAVGKKMPAMLSVGAFVKRDDGMFGDVMGGAWRSMDTPDRPGTRLVAVKGDW